MEANINDDKKDEMVIVPLGNDKFIFLNINKYSIILYYRIRM